MLLSQRATAAVALGGTSASARGADTQLSLVAYSTPREAYAKLIPMFQKTPQGEDVGFRQSYGSSGEQTRAVKAGLDADIVALSLAPDVDSSSRASWTRSGRSSRTSGMVTDSLVVFVVRDGNPKKIKSWNDLVRPDIEVITPNPFTSGGARWNVMAAYGAWRKAGKTDKQAQANLLKLFRNVAVQDTSARASLNTFNSGKGDVLLAYENEALLRADAGARPPVRDPEVDDPDREPDRRGQVEQEQGRRRTRSSGSCGRPAAQQVFADNGYRPVVKSVRGEEPEEVPGAARSSSRSTSSGSAAGQKVQKRFFDPKSSIMARIQRAGRRQHWLTSRSTVRARRGFRGTGRARPCPSAL